MEQSTTPGLLALLGLTTAVPAVLFAAGLLAHATRALYRALRPTPPAG